MSQLPNLTLYRLRDAFVRAITQASEILEDPPHRQYEGRIGATGHRLTLFTPETRDAPPPWRHFLQPAFDAEILVPNAVSTAAVLLVRPADDETPAFAITFGHGRFLMRPSAIEPRFGLYVALNAICAPTDGGGDWDPQRIRAVDAKSIGENPLLTRKQASRKALFETFGIDTRRDLVRAVTGSPVHEDWGTRMSGSDSLRIARAITLGDLGELCEHTEALYREKHYQARFRWIDYVRYVVDPTLIERLDRLTVRALREPGAFDQQENNAASDAVVGLELAPPEMLDWDKLVGFTYSIERHGESRDLSIDSYVQALRRSGRSGDLDRAALEKQTVIASVEDEASRSWSIYRCLIGSLRLDGHSYVLDEGRYYAVDTTFEAELDGFLDDVTTREPKLPMWLPVTTTRSGYELEGTYNTRIAGELGGVTMDQKNVFLSSRTSPVELCDVLTANRELIHVKPYTASATLSHLFSQGTVSAELLVTSAEFRREASEKVAQVSETALHLSDEARSSIASAFGAEFHAANFAVTYAMLGSWKHKRVADALPFFSKINLRAHVEDLRRMDYKVAVALVEAAPRDGDKPVRRRPRSEQDAE